MNDAPQPQFRGWWIPVAVVRLLESGAINPTETILLGMIDGLVSEDRGCFATNAYLAEKLNLKPRRVQVMLAKLKDLGLIRVVGQDARRRYLETCWSRPEIGAQKNARQGRSKMRPDRKGDDTSYLSAGPDRPSTGNGEGESMPFFQELEDAKETKDRGKASQADTNNAKKLEDGLRSRNKLMRQVSRQAWADEFRKMRELDGIHDSEVETVLNWYAANIGKQYVPQAYSAKAFRERWPAIVEAKGRDKTTIVASDVATDIATKLTKTPWPKGTGPQVIAAVQMSLDAFDDFAKRRRELAARTDNAKLKRWLVKLDELMGTRRSFVVVWMEQVRKRVERWPNWSGHLTSLAFDPQSEDAAKYGRNLSHAYSGSDALWNATLKECYAL
jgi:hypothetical protein